MGLRATTGAGVHRWLAAALIPVLSAALTAGRGQPPRVDAGPDQVVTLPAVATLSGTVAADGLVTVRWSIVSGPGSVEFSDATAQETQAALAAPGSYVLRLSASDGVAAASDDVTIVVVERNDPPVVAVAGDLTVAIGEAVTLTGGVSDDGLPTPARLSASWSVVGGPGSVTIADPGALRTTARFAAPGTYVLRLEANDGAATAAGDLTVVVTAPNAAPVVSAGPDRSITAPGAAVLLGDARDDGQPEPPALTLAWTVTSAPGAVRLSSPAAARTEMHATVAGTYVLRLTASDGARQAHDEVTVLVAAPTAGTGLLAAYGFDEGTGATIPDRSGHGPALTRHGATWVPAGRHGGAMVFDGVRNRATGPALPLPAAFTLMAWVRNTTTLPYETIVSVGTARALKLAFEDLVFTTPAGDLRLGPAGGPDVWHHVAVTADGTSVRGFVDGAPVGPPRPLALEPVTGVVQLGAWPLGASADFFGGALDDVRLYGRALSAEEIARDMRTPIGGAARRDDEAPHVDIDAPAGGDVVWEVVTVTATATDDVGVAGVRFSVDGQPIGAEVVAPPYWVTWDTRQTANGPHTLEVEARDDADNRTRTAVALTVTNPRPTENRAPTVSAGGDLTVTMPGLAVIEGRADDDDLPAPAALRVRWSVVSGPGGVRFEPADAATTTARFGAPGEYVLRLTADDGQLSATDEVAVTVKAAPGGGPGAAR